jgi:predicted MFS family arabinose efflux permease
MGLYMLVFVGGTPIGAPIIGVITSHFGARTGMAVCGIVPLLAALAMISIRRRPAAPPAEGEDGDAALDFDGVFALDGEKRV